MKKNYFIFLAIFFVGPDQISKLLISSHLFLGESFNLLPFLNFTLVHNPGVAFSLFDDGGALMRWVLVALITFILIYLLNFIRKTNHSHNLELTSLLFIFSGGLGNLIDRIFLGYVVDFIHIFYQKYSFYVFNLADSYITVGIILYISYVLFIEREKTA